VFCVFDLNEKSISGESLVASKSSYNEFWSLTMEVLGADM